MQLLKTANELLDQAKQRHHGHEADRDPADLAACRLTRDRLRLRSLAQNSARAFEKTTADIGEFDLGVALSRHESRAELRFEFFDLVAQRWRADAEAQRGSAEVLVVGERHEIAEQTRFDFSHR